MRTHGPPAPPAAPPTYTRGMAREPRPDHEHDHALAVETARPEVVRPPLFQVVLLNDDFTPMEIVVEVLQVFFAMTREKATREFLPLLLEAAERIERDLRRA